MASNRLPEAKGKSIMSCYVLFSFVRKCFLLTNLFEPNVRSNDTNDTPCWCVVIHVNILKKHNSSQLHTADAVLVYSTRAFLMTDLFPFKASVATMFSSKCLNVVGLSTTLSPNHPVRQGAGLMEMRPPGSLPA